MARASVFGVPAHRSLEIRPTQARLFYIRSHSSHSSSPHADESDKSDPSDKSVVDNTSAALTVGILGATTFFYF